MSDQMNMENKIVQENLTDAQPAGASAPQPEEAGKELLRIEDLHVIYKTDEALVKAVNGLNLSVRTGETLALVGETGAGKTTTALSIMRLLPQRTGSIPSGKVIFEGEDIRNVSDQRMRQIRGKDISMIFQDPMSSLNPVLTIEDQISEPLLFHNSSMKKSDALERARELLEMVGISRERSREYPHQFSGGMKQRIIIAIALACEPKLMLADEPTTALDVTIQAQVLKLMKDLQDKMHMAMIMITHDLGIVAQTCDKVAIMYAGKIIESGTVEDIFNGEKHHPYTTGLFGSIPEIRKKTRRLHPIDGLMPDPSCLPEGCAFHPRCPYAQERCRQTMPEPVVNDTHVVLCHLFSDKENETEGKK